ncbi:unnamed protein product [Fraxinus pennsylvanica]|uniref:Uncharacterized protein n=1 Tax=Fraxinus pennsylvanica TaxID=56036 RepID=A0AAD2DGK4_9LAMI|nr:unnamed protein product [Fraxinus pennsylvanica]
MTLGTYPAMVVILTNFLVVKTPMVYNTIYSRPLLNAVGAIPSTYHQVTKFPTSRSMGNVRGDQQSSRKCYIDSIWTKEPPPVMMLDLKPPRGRIEPLNTTKKILMAEGHEFGIGEDRDIQGIDPSVSQHHLGVLLGAKLIKQKKRNLTLERQAVVKDEVDKLMQVGFIREVHYPQMVSKRCPGKKLNGKWHMCVDYTGLNKVCPKDSYSLPRIDHLVDATSGHDRLSFLDAFSGYHRSTSERISKDAEASLLHGSSHGEGSGAGIIMIGPESEELEYSLRFEFPATNNDTEYEAVIIGLSLAARLGITSVDK